MTSHSGILASADRIRAEPTSIAGSRSRTRVLLVDDDPGALRRLAETLASLGLDVVGSTNDGRHAIELARVLAPDIALIDWDMPRLGGVVTAGLMGSHVPTVTPVLIVDDDVLEREPTRTMQPFATITKSSSPAEMEARLTAIARRRRTRRRLLAVLAECDGSTLDRPESVG